MSLPLPTDLLARILAEKQTAGVDPQKDLLGIPSCDLFIENASKADTALDELVKDESIREEFASVETPKQTVMTQKLYNQLKFARSRLFPKKKDIDRFNESATFEVAKQLYESVLGETGWADVVTVDTFLKALGIRLVISSYIIMSAYRYNMSASDYSSFLDFWFKTVFTVAQACSGEFELRGRLGSLDDILIKHNYSWNKWWYHVYGWSSVVGYVGSYPGDSSEFLGKIAVDWFGKDIKKTAALGPHSAAGYDVFCTAGLDHTSVPADPEDAYYFLFSHFCRFFCNNMFTKIVDKYTIDDFVTDFDNYAVGGASKIKGVKTLSSDGKVLHTTNSKGQIPGVLPPDEMRNTITSLEAPPVITLFVKPNEPAKFRGVVSGDDWLYLQMKYISFILEKSVAHPFVLPRYGTMYDKPSEFIASMDMFKKQGRSVSMPLDQSKFDRHVTLRELDVGFSSLIEHAIKLQGGEASSETPRLRQVGRVILERVKSAVVSVPNQDPFVVSGGLSSGIAWTSLANSIVNFAQCCVANYILFSHTAQNGLINLRVQGDDGRLLFSNSLLGAGFYFCLSSTGVKVNASKFFFNKDGDFYLRKLYRGNLAVGPPARTARGLTWLDPYSSSDLGEGFLEDAASNWWLLVNRTVAATSAIYGEVCHTTAKLPDAFIFNLASLVSNLDVVDTEGRPISGLPPSKIALQWALSDRTQQNGTGGGFSASSLSLVRTKLGADWLFRAASYEPPVREFTGKALPRFGSVLDRWVKLLGSYDPELSNRLLANYTARLNTPGSYVEKRGVVILYSGDSLPAIGTSFLLEQAWRTSAWISKNPWYSILGRLREYDGIVYSDVRRSMDAAVSGYIREVFGGEGIIERYHPTMRGSLNFLRRTVADSPGFKRYFAQRYLRGSTTLAFARLADEPFPMARADFMAPFQLSVVSAVSSTSSIIAGVEQFTKRGLTVNHVMAMSVCSEINTKRLVHDFCASGLSLLYIG